MKCFTIVTAYFLSLFFAAGAFGQSPTPLSPGDGHAGSLRLTLEKQQEEIDTLREELKKESELRKQQSVVLEALVNRLGKLLQADRAPMTVDLVPADLKQDAGNPVKATATIVQSDKTQQKPVVPVEAGTGKIRFNGLLQAGLLAGDENFNHTFRIRRAEIKFSGELLPKVRWTVMFDVAKALSLSTQTATVDGVPVVRTVGVNQSGRVFQEGFVTLSHIKRANFSLGQFKIPLSQEGLQSSAALDTVERALFLSDRGRGGGLGDSRDIGFMAFGPLNKQLDYQIGVFNGVGESQNDVDQNDEKAIVGRLVFKPSLIKGLQIGGSGAYIAGKRITSTRRDRLGAELVYDRDKLRVKSEFMIGVDGEVHRRAYYLHFGYRILPKLEVVARYDTFDPDIRRDMGILTTNERDYLAGVNYYIKDNHFKLQLNYVRKTFTDGLTLSRNLILTQLQTSW